MIPIIDVFIGDLLMFIIPAIDDLRVLEDLLMFINLCEENNKSNH